MKYAENSDARFIAEEIGDSIMTIEQNPDLTFGFHSVPVAHCWKIGEQLSLLVDSLQNPKGGLGVVLRNVLVDIDQPRFRFMLARYRRALATGSSGR